MRRLRVLASLSVLVLALGLMGQARNCGDLNQLLPQIDKLFGGGGGGGNSKVHVSNLSFMDADSKSVMPAGDAELINEAVQEGMSTLAASEPKYVINAPGHTLQNNDANAQKLSQIFWDANLSRADKVDKIIAELMNPSNIDGLVAGQFQEKKDGTITVRPFVIAKASKNMVTESRNFTKQEFNCTDPQNPSRKILCQKTREDIRDVVIRLLKQL